MDTSQEKLLSIGVVILLSVAGLATIIYYNDDSSDSDNNGENEWIDPIVEVENCENCTGLDQNHQHTNLMQHFLQTDNIELIDYHNLIFDNQLIRYFQFEGNVSLDLYAGDFDQDLYNFHNSPLQL